MGKRKNLNALTPYAKLRDTYNETHDKMLSQSAMGKIVKVSKSTIWQDKIADNDFYEINKPRPDRFELKAVLLFNQISTTR